MLQEALRVIDPRNRQNLNAINILHGLVRGRFQGVEYVLKMAQGNFIETCVLRDSNWEPHILELISSYLLHPNQVMIDIGANIGATTVPLAKKYINTQFYLFEPHPKAFADLQINCNYNKLANVKLFNAAVSDRNGFVQFYASTDANKLGLSSTKPNADIKNYNLIDVPCVSVDAQCAGIEDPIAVIKIDTQGTELDILRSATNTIIKHRPVIFFEFESDYYPDPQEEQRVKLELLSFFKLHRYDLFCMQRENAYHPAMSLNGYYNGDIIAVPC